MCQVLLCTWLAACGGDPNASSWDRDQRDAGKGGSAGLAAGEGAGTGVAGGGGDTGLAAPTHELAALCPERCAAAEPAPSESADCMNGSVHECRNTCIAALEDTDATCARCKLDNLSWLPANGGCGEWECVCWEGYASFPLERAAPCDDACASTLERRARTRLASPVPQSLGRAPDAWVELQDFAAIGWLAIGGDDVVWLSGSALQEDEAAVHLARLRDDLTLALIIEPPAGTWSGRVPTDLLAAPNGDALLAMWTGESHTLARFTPEGAQAWQVAVESVGVAHQVVGMRWTPGGRVLVTLAGNSGFATSLVATDDGHALATGALPEATTLRTLEAVAIDAQQRFRLPGTERGSSIGDPGVLITLANSGSEEAPVLTEVARAHFTGNKGAGQVHGLAIHEDGSAALFGHLREQRQNSAHNLSYGAPFVARLGPDGSESWRFVHDDIVTGRVHAIAFDEDGNIYAAGAEDPVEYAAEPPPGDIKCSVYGCDSLVVRKWSPSGQLLWEYQHREATSYGRALGLDSQGRLFVAGSVQREAPTGIVMRFDPQ